MQERRKLSDILHGSDRDKLAQAWKDAKADDDFAPLPSGEYVANVIDGTPFTAKSGTAGYKLTFQVAEGEHAGRRFWDDIWLTANSAPLAKRDLAKLGVPVTGTLDDTIHYLDTHPLPQGIRCKVRLALRKDDSGAEYNRVRSFDVTGIDPQEPEPFAPADNAEPTADGDAPAGRNGEGKELFPFGANAGRNNGPYGEGR